MLANDPDVSEWVYGIIHGEPVPSGEFLKCFAETIVRADPGCYASLVPAARIFMKRFPKYKCGCQVWEQPPSIPNFASVGTPVSTPAGRDAQAKKDAESLAGPTLFAKTETGWKPVPHPSAEEAAGWIVASDTGLLFRTMKPGEITWTDNRDEAIRFARREDAEMFAAEDEDAWHIIPWETR